MAKTPGEAGSRANGHAEGKEEGAPERCRIILSAVPQPSCLQQLTAALEGGDVAAVLLHAGELDERAFLEGCEAAVPLCQAAGAAVLVAGDSRAAGRSGADGLYLASDAAALKDAVARFSPKWIVGFGGVRSRHQAMEAGESSPDFILFGNIDGDIRPEPHPKNLALGEWASQVMRVPVVVAAGSSPEGVVPVAATGCDFVLLGKAVFEHGQGAGAAIAEINALLDQHAPRLVDDEG